MDEPASQRFCDQHGASSITGSPGPCWLLWPSPPSYAGLRGRCWPVGPPTARALGSSPSPNGHKVQHDSPADCRLLRCHQCSFSTLRPSHLKRHQRIHTGERPYRCHLCPNAFAQKSHLISHVHTHTGERPFPCLFCPEAFTRRIQRKTHEQKEHRHHQYIVCYWGYNKPPDLSNNMNLHFAFMAPLKPRCWCIVTVFFGGRAISSFPLLPLAGCSPNGHSRQHDAPPGRQLLYCQHCSYMTPYSSTLKKHIRTHTGECPHQCNHCGRAFTERSTLVSHLRIHTGKRPHQCSHCGKAFTEKGNLVNHLRIHTGERPHQCSHCGKAFVQRTSLVKHVRIHTGERPYKCHLCPTTFASNSGLVRHVRSHTAGYSPR
ncbi:uncharacterized protein LOC144179817 [Haemaphysalis longicornis]